MIRRAAGLLPVAAVCLLGCSGGGKSARGGGDGDAAGATPVVDTAARTPDGAAPPYLLADRDGDGHLRDAGRVEITVQWPAPPPAVLDSPGSNQCGVPRAPAASVGTLHGLRGAVVSLDGVARGVAPPPAATVELAVRDCRLEPRVQVAPRLGARLAVINDDERRHLLTLAVDARPPAGFALPLIGQRVELPLDRPGTVRVSSPAAAGDDAWVVVPPTPYAAVTDDAGQAAFAEVPAGTYQVTVWHPPVEPGSDGLRASGSVTVTAGAVARLTLEPLP